MPLIPLRTKVMLGGEEALLIEYQQQVLLEIALAPHAWKIHYMVLYPDHFHGTSYNSAARGGDVWDMLAEVASHKYSIEEWKKYLSLFDEGIRNVILRLDSILMAHGDVIPVKIKLAVLHTKAQLEVERSVYVQLPQIISTCGGQDSFFVARFRETIKPLSMLARLADKERKALEPST